MGFLINVYNIALYQPLLNALVVLYLFLPGHDFGIAVIILTLLIRVVLYPLGVQSIKSQKILQELQPKIKEIQEKFKNDKEKQSRATMELYQKEKINPLSGCLPLLLQLPILIALYQVFWNGFKADQFGLLYGFIPHPGQINTTFLGLLDLAQASAFLAIITGIAQFFQAKTATPSGDPGQALKQKDKGSPDFSQMMQKQALYFFPVFTVFILWKLPSAVALYWLVTTLFTIGQQYIIFKNKK